MISDLDPQTHSRTRSDPLTALRGVNETPDTVGMVPAGVPNAGAGPNTAPVAPIPTFGMTKLQDHLWHFLWSRQQAGEDTPSYQEMAEVLNLKSKSGVARILDGLIQRGWLERMPNRARSVVAILPSGTKARGALAVSRLMLTELTALQQQNGDEDLAKRIDLFRRLLNIAEATS